MSEKNVPAEAGLSMLEFMLEGSGRSVPTPEAWAKMTPAERRRELEKAAEGVKAS